MTTKSCVKNLIYIKFVNTRNNYSARYEAGTHYSALIDAQ
jgi:hypothetical protein